MTLCTIQNGMWQDGIVIHVHRTDKTKRRTEWTIAFIGGAHITVPTADLCRYPAIRRAFARKYPGHELSHGSAKTWRIMLDNVDFDGGQK